MYQSSREKQEGKKWLDIDGRKAKEERNMIRKGLESTEVLRRMNGTDIS